MIATKKITPGGHWIGITAIASRVNKSDFLEVCYLLLHGELPSPEDKNKFKEGVYY